MTPETPGPRVLVLRCRACRTVLPAASNDVAFRCPRCGRGWEIGSQGLEERLSVFVAPPTASPRPLLYLPYWSFAISARADPPARAEAAELVAKDRAAHIRRAWVSAYAIYRPTYVGEWGLVYTRIQPRWEVRRGHGPVAMGTVVTSADAREVIHHYVLAEIDRAVDIGSLDLQVEIGEPELWAVPCIDLGRQLRCPWTRAELPANAIDDLVELRQGAERWEA